MNKNEKVRISRIFFARINCLQKGAAKRFQGGT